jgi:hypothetical protein
MAPELLPDVRLQLVAVLRWEREFRGELKKGAVERPLDWLAVQGIAQECVTEHTKLSQLSPSQSKEDEARITRERVSLLSSSSDFSSNFRRIQWKSA